MKPTSSNPKDLSTDEVHTIISQQLELMQQQLALLQELAQNTEGGSTPHLNGSSIENFRETLKSSSSLNQFQESSKDSEVFPLTESLNEIWLASQTSEEGALSFNESIQLQFDGEVDFDALRDALNCVLQRHESLRAIYLPGGEGFRILPTLELDLPIVDATSLSQAEASEKLEAEREVERNAAFELVGTPLIRARIVSLPERKSVLLLTTHHLICDGWSFNVFTTDLGKFYSELVAGKTVTVEPAPQFSEFAKAEAKRSLHRKDSDDFWESRFEETVPPLALPQDGDRPGADDASFRCETVREHIDATTLTKLRQLSSDSGATMFGLLLGAYRVLLSRLGRQSRIMTPFPLSGQGASIENEDLVGQCVNFIPFVSEVDADLSFTDYLKQTQTDLLEALDHQDYTYGRLLGNLPSDKRPTLEAAFKYELLQSYDDFVGLRAELKEVSANYLFYPLFLDVLEGTDTLEIQFTCQTDKFSREMVSQWLQSYRAIIEAIANTPEATVSEIAVSITEIQWKQLADWNETHVDYPSDRTIVSLFDEIVSQQPEAIALKWDGGEMTYRELQDQSSRVAQYLKARNVSKGDRIGLFLDRSPERLSAILGIVKLGAAYVPIDPEYPAERLDLILEDSGAGLVISQNSLSARLPRRAKTIIEIQEALGGDARIPLPETFSGDSAKTALCIMYTSGSTGTPKGAVYAHRGMIRAIRNLNYCDLNPNETVLHTSSICFDVSTFEMFGALLNGATLAIPPAEPLSLGTITDCIARHDVTTLWLTSGLFQLMVEEELPAFVGVRQLLTGGDIVPVTHARALKEAYPDLRLINCYGPTENTTYTTARTITEADLALEALPVGGPINNSSAWILDENQKPLPPGMAGELYCGGDGVCLGYLNKPELTAEKFVKVQLHPGRPTERLYRTGDLCRYRADGTIDFIGRMDHQVKIRGFRVEPGEIETCLSIHPHVGQCKVVTVGENATEKSLVAYVSPLNGYRPTPEELREYSHSKLPAYMVPASLIILDELPVNTNGKIDTKALPAPGTEAALEPSPAPASDDIEERLTDLWEKTLKVNPIGLDEDFFALGGHSLLGMKLFSRIQREFDLSLPLSVLFKHPTVRLLGSEITHRIEAGEAVTQSPLSYRDDSPPGEGNAALAKSDRARTSRPIIHTPPRGLAETTVLLQPEGPETALFGVHGGDGGIFFYRDLAAHLEKNRPIYAFEAANLTNRGEVQVESVEGMAARYIAELRKVQPEGPYFLCGYSFGGIVAFEMACQLQQTGAEIGFLGIIDVNNPAADPRPRSISERVAMTWKGPDKERSTLLRKASRLGGRIARGLGYRIQADSQWLAAKTLPSAKNTGWLRLAQVRRANTIAQENYTQPSVFHGEVSLFRAMEGNDKHDLGDTYGWERIVQGKIHTYDVSGSHVTIFNEENISDISRAMDEALSRTASTV